MGRWPSGIFVISGNERLRVQVPFCVGTYTAQKAFELSQENQQFPNRSDTNRAVQVQEMAKSLKFRFKEEEGLYCQYSENKGADQLHGYREAGLCLWFHICSLLG